MRILTVGFAQRTAEEFFEALRRAGVRSLIDVRLRPRSQLAGFASQRHLPYLLRVILDASYHHEPLLAPTADLVDGFKKQRSISWQEYEQGFLALLEERGAADRLDRGLFDVPAVLMCSEASPENCHRRLVAEHLQQRWGDVIIEHL